MIPRREPRPLSRREIFQAIQNDLAQRGISGREELRPGDLKFNLRCRSSRMTWDYKSRESALTPFGAKRCSNSGLPMSRSIFLLRSPRDAIRRVWG